MAWCVGAAVLVAVVVARSGGLERDAEEAAKSLLAAYHKEAAEVFNNSTKASWAYFTNITDENRRRKEEAAERSRLFKEQWNQRSREFIDSDLTPETRRIMKKAFKVQLGEADARNLTQLLSTMSSIYAKGEVCLPGKECLPLDPGLSAVMAESRNYTELRDAWQGWRTNVGRKVRPHYLQYLSLMNKAAQLNQHPDAGHEWRDRYESPGFEEAVVALYREVEPLYRLLHAYVRRRLREHYPEHIDADGPLPACVLGDMWGRFWTNIAQQVTPYPSLPPLDVTPRLRALSHTPESMFRMGDSFFTSMGLQPVPDTFWTRSMLAKPEGRDVMCHPTAWDFYDGKDFRIKMCTQVTMEDLQVIHHELGHVQYFMQYAHLPLTYRDGANDGFHEAVGELVGMVMATPQHLARRGLLRHLPKNTHELTINYLMRAALQTITTLPFHLTYDLWRWRVWGGQVEERAFNDEFWRLRLQYTGVAPPVARTTEDLDPPALYHVTNNYDTIRYFTRTILQFQILEALCKEAGHTGPLHTCDLYGSKEAGRRLADAMAVGASRPWPSVLKMLTGVDHISAEPLKRYFEPLMEWLENNATKAGEDFGGNVGWDEEWKMVESGVQRAAAGGWRHAAVLSLLSVAVTRLVPLLP